jgi:2-keto-4-pentenoate hydratase/2-oxohepta-3-ene-1,7-dioic acid hydratase in catechol pathway
VFTKFPSCITGPHGDIELPPGGHVDWEVELVAVIGRLARHVPTGRGLEYVAGYAVGQDISERVLQLAATPALVANLSASVALLPGDVIFTGTPAGVGLGRDPQRWLADGDVLTSHIEGIGEMRHRFVAGPAAR